LRRFPPIISVTAGTAAPLCAGREAYKILYSNVLICFSFWQSGAGYSTVMLAACLERKQQQNNTRKIRKT
jgi:hypothetical protein